MSTDIDNAFIKQYETEVHEAYQRRGSLLGRTIRRRDNVKGKTVVFQKVGKGTASQKARHGKVPVMNIDHTPVDCHLEDYYGGDWVDKLDELKIAHNEREVQVNGGAYALGRKTDSLIIDKLDTATNSTNKNLSALTVGDLTTWVTNLGARDVPVDDGNVFGVVSWQVWNQLLTIEQFVNADYIGAERLDFGRAITAKAWLGVIWIPHSGLTLNGTRRDCHVYHRTALGFGSGMEVTADITWHGDMASHFVNHMMSQGACLIDDNGVETLAIDEAA